MPDLQLSIIGSPSDVVDPLFAGEVKPEGIELVPTRADGSTGYWRQVTFNEFDVSSLSCASYIIAKTKGYDAIALPVFSSRRFMHVETATTPTPASMSPLTSRASASVSPNTR